MSDMQATSAERRGPEEIQAEINETREELGETVEALAEKGDVKAQAKARFDDVREEAKQRADQVKRDPRANPEPIIAGILAVVIGLVILRKLRSR